MKTSPEVEYEEKEAESGQALEGRVAQVAARAKDVVTSLSVWRTDMMRQWYRRYVLLNRDVQYPWQDASNVVMPMSDMHIGKLKPPLMNAIFGGPRMVNCRPRSAAAWDTKDNIDLLMDCLLRGGGPHAIPDFKLQIAYGIDNMLWSGRGIWKTWYDYQITTRTECVRAGAMPGMLGRLSIVPNIKPGERQAAMQQFPWLNAPEVLQWLGTQQPVQPMDKVTFAQFEKVIRTEVIKLYGLDMEEPVDKKASDDIMAFLRGGTKEGSIEITTRAVERDGPAVTAVSPFDFFVPWGTKIDLTGTDIVIHQVLMTKAELRRRAAANKWIESGIETAIERGRYYGNITVGATTVRPVEFGSTITSATFVENNTVALWDIYVREDLHGDDSLGWVNYIIEPNSATLLKRCEFKAAHGRPPFIVAPLEHNSDDFFESRGVPKILYDAESHATALYRAIENNLILTTTPTFKARATAFIDPEGAQIIPGEVVGVDRMDDIEQFQMQSNTFPLERLLASFMPWPEQLVGSMDISAASNQRLTEPRTRYEVERVAAYQMGVLGLRADLLLTHFGRLCAQVLALFRQYGPDSFYISAVGEDPVRLTQAQIRGEVDVLPSGSAGDMDPNYRFQRIMSILGIAQNFEPLIANDPRYVPDRGQLYIDALNEFDPMIRQRYIKRRTPQEMQQFMQMQQQQAQRAQQIADIAQRVEMNAGISKQEGAIVLNEVAKRMPHHALTEMQREGQAATQQMEAAGVLARS